MPNQPNKMSNKDKMEQVLEHNPKVSKSVVAEYRELRKKLERLGVNTKMKPHYTVSPPLGNILSNLPKK